MATKVTAKTKTAKSAKKPAKAAAASKKAKKAPEPKSRQTAAKKKTPPRKGAAKEQVVAAPPPPPKKKPVNRVQIRVIPKSVRRQNALLAKAQQQAAQPPVEIDTAKAVAFAMSIAQEMKRSARSEDERRSTAEIRLTRRPTTRTQGRNTSTFPAADLKEFRKRLLLERDRALQGVNAMKATGFNEAEDHEADGGDGTNQTLRLQALGQMGNINRTIQKIEEALHRIDDGSYGVCTICGQLIRKPRLINQPFVLTCMECQNEMERNKG